MDYGRPRGCSFTRLAGPSAEADLFRLFLGRKLVGARSITLTPSRNDSSVGALSAGDVMLADHTYSRLNRLRDDIKTFVAERVRPDPNLRRVEVRYLGGWRASTLARMTCSSISTSTSHSCCW